MTSLLLLGLGQLDLSWIVAGHGYDFSGGPAREGPAGEAEDGGIPTFYVVAVAAMAVATIGFLVSLNPSATLRRVRTIGPKALILLIIAAPLVAWTATGGGGEDVLSAERGVGPDGAPEILVSLEDDELNKPSTAAGKRFVRLECVGVGGQLVVGSRQPWPFVEEEGFDVPHAHQPATREQLRRADRCRILGTTVRLEAVLRG